MRRPAGRAPQPIRRSAPAAALLALAALMPVCAARAQSTAATAAEAGAPHESVAAANPASAPTAPQRWALVPILISNAETGVQVGALTMLFLNPGDTLNKPSSIGFAARISQKAQVEINLFPEWYLDGNRYHVVGGVKYIRWPADFYGLGNGSDIPKDSADGYLAQGVMGDMTVERKLFRNFSAGPQALFKYESIEEKGAGDLLTDTVPGHQGAFTSGLGAVVTYDGRDAIYWARTGTYLSAKAASYRSFWGSGFDYEDYVFEARQFLPVSATGAVGLSAKLEATAGNVPFRDLPTADGDHSLRGIVRGKYRDRNLLLLQSEFKNYFPDWSWMSHPWFRNRLGYAVFAEVGQVAHELGDLDWAEFRPGFGVGLRYAMNPAQRMNIRIDLGFVDGTVAPAINIKEAF
jgi:hypothetical protein